MEAKAESLEETLRRVIREEFPGYHEPPDNAVHTDR
jgi:hypothetical protein